VPSCSVILNFVLIDNPKLLLMEYLLDDPESEQIFQDILRKIRPLQNGEVADSMTKRGIEYKINLGASVISLQQLAAQYKPNHLVALKLWNKQWRETMILATLLDEPAAVTSNQMDFWAKNFRNIEIAMNLFSKTIIAYEKATEYCLGKKTLIKITGLLMMGRLALTDKQASDEKFETFFELFPPLAKDPQLSLVFTRVFIQIGMRNINLYNIAQMQANILKTIDSQAARYNADQILSELECEGVREIALNR
jgi:3-methyladenine DNA glycosylase AlkD